MSAIHIKKVHVVCKTHLDIGFTDLAEKVLHRYVFTFLPASIQLAKEVNLPGEKPLFIWTVGSYLIDYALKHGDEKMVEQVDEAVKKGYIAYHALPFTFHSELANETLFKQGLAISKTLDKRYGKHTIAAKMTDVPGHTIGIVSPMVEADVGFLHIGINGVASLAKVPEMFVWENEKGQQLIVNYGRNYGGITTVDGLDEAMYLFHTQDNMGPPSKEELSKVFDTLQKDFPNAEIVASTLDDFSKSVQKVKNHLPVVKEEIGDTWIHGMGVDPLKVEILKKLCRFVDFWDQNNTWNQYFNTAEEAASVREDFLLQLLLVCEHTWGMDTKKYLPDYKNWTRGDFDKARKTDIIDVSLSDGMPHRDLVAFGKKEFEAMEKKPWQPTYSLFESSHEEQRNYLYQAIQSLPKEMQEAVKGSDVFLKQNKTAFSPIIKVAPQEEEWLFSYEEKGLFTLQLPIYQQVGKKTYQDFFQNSLDCLEENWLWAYPDNGKPGFEDSDAPIRDDNQKMDNVTIKKTSQGWKSEGFFNQSLFTLAGSPEKGELSVEPFQEGWLITVKFFNKPANRKPEGLFLPIVLQEGTHARFEKIATTIDPTQTVEGGNQRSHFVQNVILEKDDNQYTITPLDSGLVSINEPSLLHFANKAPIHSLYFGLYSNLWGTNFKMWYEEDIVARFVINKK